MFRDVDRESAIGRTNTIPLNFRVDFDFKTVVVERVIFDERIEVIAAKTRSINAIASLRKPGCPGRVFLSNSYHYRPHTQGSSTPTSPLPLRSVW